LPGWRSSEPPHQNHAPDRHGDRPAELTLAGPRRAGFTVAPSPVGQFEEVRTDPLDDPWKSSAASHLHEDT